MRKSEQRDQRADVAQAGDGRTETRSKTTPRLQPSPAQPSPAQPSRAAAGRVGLGRGLGRQGQRAPPPGGPGDGSRRPGTGAGRSLGFKGAGIKPPRQRAPFILACGAAAAASAGAEHHRAATPSHLPTCPTNQTWLRSRNLTSPN